MQKEISAYSVTVDQKTKEKTMLHYSVIFFVIALVAAFFGFSGIASGAAEIAKILFFVFLIITIVSLIVGIFNKR